MIAVKYTRKNTRWSFHHFQQLPKGWEKGLEGGQEKYIISRFHDFFHWDLISVLCKIKRKRKILFVEHVLFDHLQ